MKTKHPNWPKYVLQFTTLAALIFFLSGLAAKIFTKMEPADPETYCPMGGLEALVTYFVNGSLPCSMTSMQIVMGIALAAAIILFSKLFCAYICPVGTIEDLLIQGRKALKIKAVSIKNGSIADRALRLIKYALLFWIFYMTATASELFCKNLDPYYAVATGFKGEITLWMSITTLSLVVLGGFFINRFWCKYICPLGAVSNSLKFWGPLAVLIAIYWALGLLGLGINWLFLLGAACLLGWALEVFCGKPHCQLLYVIKDEKACNHCGVCSKKCPYDIDLDSLGSKINAVDCTLCGDCLRACNQDALSIGMKSKSGKKCAFAKFVPAILAIVIVAAGYFFGQRFELPTIDVKWDVEDGMELTTTKVENLRSVKCYGSSMAFKARMQKVPGVHGVKTYVGSHTVVISYDPKVTDADKIQREIFVPSHFRIWSPDPKKLSELKVVTIRTEKMYDKLDLNYLGLQFRTTGKSIFGVESEYACPLVVRVYMSPEEQLDEAWFEEVVERKVLAMPVHGGGVKETPVNFKFVRLEEGESTIGIDEYLHRMFDPFTAEFSGEYVSAEGDTTIQKRVARYEGKPQFIYEVADQNYEKPIIKRGLPFLSNHLSKEEGVIGVYLRLNAELVPSIQIRFAAPMTEKKLWELMTAEKWTITYKKDDVREENPRMKFEEQGICYPFKEVSK